MSDYFEFRMGLFADGLPRYALRPRGNADPDTEGKKATNAYDPFAVSSPVRRGRRSSPSMGDDDAWRAGLFEGVGAVPFHLWGTAGGRR